MIRVVSFLTITIFFSLQGCAQKSAGNAEAPTKGDKSVGGPCENCDAIFETSVPFAQLNEVDTLPDFADEGPRIEISGKIFKSDGKTPATNVVMYVYHTNQDGIYPKRGNEKGYDRYHGYLRGWIRTDENGFYRFFTLRPASYPNSRALAHIHAIIKEEGKTRYWIDDFLFADDPFLDESRLNKNPRGGSGVMKMEAGADGTSRGKRDIVLLD